MSPLKELAMKYFGMLSIFFVLNAHANNPIDIWQEFVKEYSFDLNKQSFCFETNGEVVGMNINRKIRPASVTKLYVTYWALKNLKKDHRFHTEVLIDGNHLHIKGGQDSFFVSENLFAIMTQLNELGHTHFEKVTFDNNFFLNWTDDTKKIKTILKKYFNTRNWSSYIKSELNKTVLQSTEFSTSVKVNPILKLSVENVLFDESVPNNYQEKFTFSSSPLYMHLKQMNVYSTNFLAQKFFDYMGGTKAFHEFMNREFQTTKKDFYFYTGSGLGENYTTCSITLRLNKSLLKTITEQGLHANQVISVPGSDTGTLRNRFTETEYNKSILAKTGTLRHTSTLSGYISTISGMTYFGVFNHTYETKKARTLQNNFVKELYHYIPEKEFFDYKKIEYFPLLRANLLTK